MLSEAEDRITRYPDIQYRRLRSALARNQGLQPENVLVGNGATELIYLVARMFSGRRALLPGPTFSEYQAAVQVQGGHVEHLMRCAEDTFHLPLAQLDQRLASVSGVFLCRPNNPDGSLHPAHKLIAVLPRDAIIISDESFLDFVPGGEQESLVWHLDAFPRLIILRSLTKFYALPGLRLGYALAGSDLASRLRECQPPWTVNSLASEIGTRIVANARFRRNTHRWLAEERPFLQEALAELGIRVYPGRANFLLCRLPRRAPDAPRLKDEMVGRGILIRDASSFTGLDHRYFRVAVKARRDNLKLLSALKDALGG